MFLEKYKNLYNDFYSIFFNVINENKINHAYMFEVDSNLNQEEFINDICKIIFLNNSSNPQIEKMIDNGLYPNIKIIESDGNWIKKEQILEVEKDFMEDSLDNNYKIYIIKDAEKLNNSSANTLLKFLEEPEEKIIAILLTKNRYSVIPTIVSRCQNISLKSMTNGVEICSEDSIEIVNIIEKHQVEALPYLNKFLIEKKYDKKEFFDIFENIQKIYFDLILINNKQKSNYFSEESLKEIKYTSNKEQTIKMVDMIEKSIDYLKCNVNIKTLFDKIIIEVYGGD